MRFTMNRPMLWSVVLILGFTAVAIPIGARVSLTSSHLVHDSQESFGQRTPLKNETAPGKVSGKTASVVYTSGAPQDRYERRRQYWENRIDRRIESRQRYMDDQVDREDKAGRNNDDDDDDDEDMGDDDDDDSGADEEMDRIERRRENWRNRVEREW
ncbi:MAG TPA: hypothetical protein VJV05_16410 [Pyrinomonadaceae bacterium]|nr:hypothetical protein [Pyrinomonadaceae bacterium]